MIIVDVDVDVDVDDDDDDVVLATLSWPICNTFVRSWSLIQKRNQAEAYLKSIYDAPEGYRLCMEKLLASTQPHVNTLVRFACLKGLETVVIHRYVLELGACHYDLFLFLLLFLLLLLLLLLLFESPVFMNSLLAVGSLFSACHLV
jgi:hypothetical protein